MLRCFAYGCPHTCCRAWGFLCFLTVLRPPSGSGSTGSSGYSSPLGFPTFAMGSPLRGRGLFVLDRNEGVVSPFGSGPLVSSWLDLKPLSVASASPVPPGVLLDGPPYVRELRLSLAPSSVLPCPLLGFRVASAAFAAVWGCLGRPALLLPAWVLYLGWWLGLRPAVAGALLPDGPHWRCGLWEVLGSLHCAPLAVSLLPGPPSLLCLLSAGCFGLAPFSFG